MKTDGKEIRFFTIHARDIVSGNADGKQTENESKDYVEVEGKAVSFNDETVLYKDPDTGFELRETILPEAFSKTDMSDVVFDLNHDTNYPFSRTRKGNLSLSVKPDGVYFNARMWKDDERAMECYKKIKHGDYDQCSFMFTCGKDGREEIWDDNDTKVKAVIRNVDKLYDVSVVTFPAYSNTEVSARFAQELDSYREKADAEKLERMRKEILSIHLS